MRKLPTRLRCWWIRNWHWMPWNWIPRRAYVLWLDGMKGYIVYDPIILLEEVAHGEPTDDWKITRQWISPHSLEQLGEFQGW